MFSDCLASFIVPSESMTTLSVSPFRRSAAVLWRVVVLVTALVGIARAKIASIEQYMGLILLEFVIIRPLKADFLRNSVEIAHSQVKSMFCAKFEYYPVFFRAVKQFSLYADYTEDFLKFKAFIRDIIRSHCSGKQLDADIL